MSSAEYQREWRKRNPDKTSQYCKKYREANPELMIVLRANWRNENLEHIKLYSKNYLQENLIDIVTKTRNKRAKKRNLPGTHTKADIEKLWMDQSGLCNSCFKRLDKYDVDHIMPQSRGGSNGPENLQLLCPSCNRSKNSKTMEEWITYKELMENKSKNG